MRFGICIGGDRTLIPKVKQYGYDYIEIALADFSKFSDEEIEEIRQQLDELDIRVETANGFFFGFERGYLTGDNVDFAGLEAYTRMVLAKGKKLGLELAVVGSAAARSIVNEAKREQGEETLAKVFRLLADIGEELGVRIVIEPLNPKECNEINTVADGIKMMKQVNHPNLCVLADFFHVAMSGEGLSTIETCGDALQHVHIARGHEDRNMPTLPEDAADCAAWAAALKKNGYDKRISLEGDMWDDWDDTVIKMREVLKVFE